MPGSIYPKLIPPVILAALLAGWACRGEAGRRADVGQRSRAEPVVREGPFAMADHSLYRSRDGQMRRVAAFPSSAEPTTDLAKCGEGVRELGAPRFRRLVLGRDSTMAVWVTAGVGTCVGVVSIGEPAVRVLDYWVTAVADSVLWAPAGRYVAIRLIHEGQRRSLEVYDVSDGVRLEMPWEQDCRYHGDCDVERVAWLGGTLLDVGIRLGPAEQSVPFEVNVAAAVPVEIEEEM